MWEHADRRHLILENTIICLLSIKEHRVQRTDHFGRVDEGRTQQIESICSLEEFIYSLEDSLCSLEDSICSLKESILTERSYELPAILSTP